VLDQSATGFDPISRHRVDRNPAAQQFPPY
jgi:hypothetical protein